MVPDETRAEPAAQTPESPAGPSRVEGIAKLLLGAAGLVILVALLSIIPPLDRPMPWAPDNVFVTFQTVITALVTVVIVGLFIVVADELEALVVERLDGPDALVRDAGALAKYLVIFLVLVASYGPLVALARPFLAPSETVWVFDLGFVLVSLLPLGIAAYVVAGDLDDLAGLLVGAFRAAGDRIESGRNAGATDEVPASGADRAASTSDEEAMASEGAVSTADGERVDGGTTDGETTEPGGDGVATAATDGEDAEE